MGIPYLERLFKLRQFHDSVYSTVITKVKHNIAVLVVNYGISNTTVLEIP